MTFTTREKILILVPAFLFSFAIGRWSNRGSTEVKTATIDIKNTDLNKNTHTETVIVKQKDGTEVTTIKQDTTTNVVKTETDKVKTDVVAKTPAPIINISALASIDTREKIMPTYGISVSKEILGPVTVGVFGLTNGILGVSVGLNF